MLPARPAAAATHKRKRRPARTARFARLFAVSVALLCMTLGAGVAAASGSGERSAHRAGRSHKHHRSTPHSSRRKRHRHHAGRNATSGAVCKQRGGCHKTTASAPAGGAGGASSGSSSSGHTSTGSGSSSGTSSSGGSSSTGGSSSGGGSSSSGSGPSSGGSGSESSGGSSGGSSSGDGPSSPGETTGSGESSSDSSTGSLQNSAEPLRLFSASSVFNEQLPSSAPLASDSATLVKAFTSQVSKYYGHVMINTTEWSTPVYVVGPNAATTALVGESSICARPEGVFSGFQEQIDAVPIPANALPAAGTDKEVIVWQPSTGHLWELWRVLKEGGHWTACWGGEIADAYTSEGIFPAPFGAGASGLSLLGGQIHLEDLEHGAIDHALEVLMPETARSEFVWPADRTDGETSSSTAIPEGTRFRLKASLNLASLHLNAAALEIATAIQRYGMIVADTAGAVALSAQDPTPLIEEGKPNPYNTLMSTDPDDVLDAIPWGELEVVSPSYHG